MLARFLTEVRRSARALIARPSFTLIAVLTLALGIGANTAVFSLFHQIVMRPLQVPQPEQLVNFLAPGPKWGNTSNSRIGPREAIFSYPMFRDLQAKQQGFTDIAAHRDQAVNLAIDGNTQVGQALLVSPAYFAVLQLGPALGRLIGPEDDAPIGQSQIAVLSHEYWKNTLRGRPDVINQIIKVNGVALTIIGVAPAGFRSTTFGSQPQVFVPLNIRWLLAPQAPKDHDNRLSHWLYLFARLRPGYRLDQAGAQTNQVYQQIINEVEVPLQPGAASATMAQFKAKQLSFEPGASGQSSTARTAATPLILLLAVSALVLLVACLNTANLLLARASTRVGELALRASIGAPQAQLLREQLIESVLLAILGGLGSLPIALLCIQGLAAALPSVATASIDTRLDWTTMYFAMAVALLTVLIFGLLPALFASRTAPILSLKGSSQTGGSRAANRFRNALAIAQIALSMVSLVMAGLFIQSLSNLSRVELGMQVESVATFALSPERNGYAPTQSAQLFAQVEAELGALPGVASVTTSLVPLLSGNDWGTGVSVEGWRTETERAHSYYNLIGTDYFRTLGITMLAGRDFTPGDTLDRPKVAIVNRQFAEKYGLGQGTQAIGKRMAVGDGAELDIEIVGLVEDSHYSGVKQGAPEQFFLPYRQEATIGSLNFYVRGALPPERLLTTISQATARVDPNLPIEDLATMPQTIQENLLVDRFVGLLSTAFAVLATLLAAGGVYGALTFSLSQRTREIGLRLALGAAPARIRSGLIGQVALLFAIGAGIGLILALMLGQSAQALLFELDGYEPTVWASAVLVLACVAFLAAWWPARRASRIDPLVALRWE